MKLTKIQYKKLEELMPIARKERYQTTNSCVQFHVCNALHNREWLPMDGTTEKIWKVARSLYEI